MGSSPYGLYGPSFVLPSLSRMWSAYRAISVASDLSNTEELPVKKVVVTFIDRYSGTPLIPYLTKKPERGFATPRFLLRSRSLELFVCFFNLGVILSSAVLATRYTVEPTRSSLGPRS
ncbi:hypothetical protein HG530_003382 [Fusarium avenaceum]|nr:hypothetical protein HG530_003382 [Fusarium avenaceum]